MTLNKTIIIKLSVAVAMAVCFSAGFSWINHHNTLYAAGSNLFWTPKIAWDARIPFIPETVWIYFLYYPLCFTALWLVKDTPAFYRVAASLSLEFVASFVVFYLFPARMDRPTMSAPGWTGEAVRMLYTIDPGYNIFPSLHVANLVLVSILFLHFGRYRSGLAIALATICVSISTLTVKQHYLMDVLSGTLLAVMSYYLVFVQRYGGYPLFAKAGTQGER